MIKRIALIIGINDYDYWRPLKNAINDAEDMASLFERLGYTVISTINPTYDEFCELMGHYEDRVQDYDDNVFYYAGHGFEYQGENYLVSLDCRLEVSQAERIGKSIKLSQILDYFKRSPKTKNNIVILDACRKTDDRGTPDSLTAQIAPKGTLIAFSTSPGIGASDLGLNGRNSRYTENLLKIIERENITVEAVFKKVRQLVFTQSHSSQTTWEHTSLIHDFYFNYGQLVNSIDIPYKDNVVKDKDYQFEESETSKIIYGFKSYNWYEQNNQLNHWLRLDPNQFDKNDLFIIGRNILQASDGGANDSYAFIENLERSLLPYFQNDENHVLNGILFEMYFNSSGEIRRTRLKGKNWERIINLRKIALFQKSFLFIQNLLSNYKEYIFYIPNDNEEIVDIIIDSTIEVYPSKIEYRCIKSIKVNLIEISKEMKSDLRHHLYSITGLALKHHLKDFFHIPYELIKIHPESIESENIRIVLEDDENEW